MGVHVTPMRELGERYFCLDLITGVYCKGERKRGVKRERKLHHSTINQATITIKKKKCNTNTELRTEQP